MTRIALLALAAFSALGATATAQSFGGRLAGAASPPPKLYYSKPIVRDHRERSCQVTYYDHFPQQPGDQAKIYYCVAPNGTTPGLSCQCRVPTIDVHSGQQVEEIYPGQIV